MSSDPVLRALPRRASRLPPRRASSSNGRAHRLEGSRFNAVEDALIEAYDEQRTPGQSWTGVRRELLPLRTDVDDEHVKRRAERPGPRHLGYQAVPTRARAAPRRVVP